MRQTILIAAALMLVLSAALFAVSPVHAWGLTCPGVSALAGQGYGSTVSGGAPNGAGQGIYNPLNGPSNDCYFAPAPQNP
jgi:hypothetical protein